MFIRWKKRIAWYLFSFSQAYEPSAAALSTPKMTERPMVIHPHHGLSTKEVVIYLGMIVGFEMHGGEHIEGRVVAVDELYVYLTRTKHHTVALHDIKQVVNHPF
jgi:hypothetical protein